MNNKYCCLIPVKKNSSRLKNKNFLILGKKSLLQRAVDKAKKSGVFDKIYISSDFKNLKKLEKENVEFLERPIELSKDPATITDVMLNACNLKKLKDKKYKLMIVLSVTNPFFSKDDIKNSITYFNKTNFEGLLSISKSNSPPYNAWLTKNKQLIPAFKNSKYKYVKSTECPTTYYSNGAIRIVKIDNFLKKKNFHKLKLTFFEMENEKSLDIDNKFEYELAKKIIK
tara:strand:+ start:1838 stop:2518 length:681 start_codon:yes stop_codon:yes gene_type:complete